MHKYRIYPKTGFNPFLVFVQKTIQNMGLEACINIKIL